MKHSFEDFMKAIRNDDDLDVFDIADEFLEHGKFPVVLAISSSDWTSILEYIRRTSGIADRDPPGEDW